MLLFVRSCDLAADVVKRPIVASEPVEEIEEVAYCHEHCRGLFVGRRLLSPMDDLVAGLDRSVEFGHEPPGKDGEHSVFVAEPDFGVRGVGPLGDPSNSSST